MAAFNKFNQFVEDIAKGVHNLSTGAIKVALTASANPPVATNAILANLTEISYTNLSSRAVTTTSCTQTSGAIIAGRTLAPVRMRPVPVIRIPRPRS